MFRIGAHVSIADGFAAAVEREAELGGNCGQVFVGSPRGWAVSEVDEGDADAFRDAASEFDVSPWIVHGTYLINLATPKDDLATKSIECVQAELEATATLDIPYYVFHPGAHTGAGSETGIANVAERLSELDIPDGVMILLENTAGKGTTVGKRLPDLNEMVESSAYDYDDLGICLDTCHLFAAGYDFGDEAVMDDLVTEIDATVGLENVHYLHLNDSRHPLGSEKDEHEHIGEGAIGEAGFRRFITHDALRDKPMVLETPENEKGFAWNIETVKHLYAGD
ncbi:deoxyribonuclease IV [Halopenitus sp. H-Gu1]|uniref:deoxyribonuclease IV n=1 Tax=Halopenitus sp. H-Gu1 TaxID=3242697 RepID=UPI00359CD53B